MSTAVVAATLNRVGIPTGPILIVNRPTLALRVTTVGLGGGVNADLESSANNGASWSVASSYTTDQTNTLVTPANAGLQYRLKLTANPSGKDVAVKLSQES